jgi:general secretion pathway protein J
MRREPIDFQPGAPQPRRRPAGFTLIEILLAVAIFGLVLVAIHSVFHVALRLRNRTVQSIEADIPLQQTLAILRRDLAGIVPPGGTFGGAVESNPSTDSTLLTGAPLVQFHTATGNLSDEAPWADIQRVAYSLVAPTNTTSEGMDLVRSVTRNLLPVAVDTIDSQRLMGGIESMTFQFHDGTAWQATWDSTNEVILLPRAIMAQIHRVVPSNTRTADRLPPIELVVGLLVEAAPDASATNATSSTGQTSGGSNPPQGGGGNNQPPNTGNPPQGGGGAPRPRAARS